MNFLDFFGAALSLICTYYFTKSHRIAWVIGAIAIIVNSILYYKKSIYGALILESIYFVSMIWGWYQWSRPVADSKMRLITFLKSKTAILIAVSGIAAIALFSQYLVHFTDSDIPYLDAITTVLALIAQALLALKIIHCWILWFIVDAMNMGLQLYKGIVYHSAMHGIYLIFAISGYLKWHKLYQMQPGLQNSALQMAS